MTLNRKWFRFLVRKEEIEMIHDLIAYCQEKPTVRYPIVIGVCLIIGILFYLNIQQTKQVSIEEYISKEENWII